MYEISGYSDLLGELLGEDDDMAVKGEDDSFAVLGAALQAASPAAKAQLAKAIRARKIQNSAILTRRAPRSSGTRPIGFNQAGVAAAATVTITTQPQEVFKGHRLVIPETIAPFFTLDNILVGNKSQFPANTPLPGEMFVPGAEAVELDLETVNPAINLSLIVTNISGVAQNFRAGMTGRQVDV